MKAACRSQTAVRARGFRASPRRVAECRGTPRGSSARGRRGSSRTPRAARCRTGARARGPAARLEGRDPGRLMLFSEPGRRRSASRSPSILPILRWLETTSPRDLIAGGDGDAAQLLGREQLLEQLSGHGQQGARVGREQHPLAAGGARALEDLLHPVEGDGALAGACAAAHHRRPLHGPAGQRRWSSSSCSRKPSRSPSLKRIRCSVEGTTRSG
jgi:hypothetical protein